MVMNKYTKLCDELDHLVSVARNAQRLSKFENGSLKIMSTYSDSDNFELPVIVEGTLITPGEYDDGILPEDELKKVYKEWEGKEVWKYHSAYWDLYEEDKDTPIDAIVGRIIKTWWDKSSNAVKYIAEILDRDIAYKIYKGLIKSVSVGFLYDPKIDEEGRKIKTEIEPKELSLVYKPKDENASIKVKEIKFK